MGEREEEGEEEGIDVRKEGGEEEENEEEEEEEEEEEDGWDGMSEASTLNSPI